MVVKGDEINSGTRSVSNNIVQSATIEKPIKIQKNALKDQETKNIAIKVSQQTESELVEVRGHTFILYKHKSKNQ